MGWKKIVLIVSGGMFELHAINNVEIVWLRDVFSVMPIAFNNSRPSYLRRRRFRRGRYGVSATK